MLTLQQFEDGQLAQPVPLALPEDAMSTSTMSAAAGDANGLRRRQVLHILWAAKSSGGFCEPEASRVPPAWMAAYFASMRAIVIGGDAAAASLCRILERNKLLQLWLFVARPSTVHPAAVSSAAAATTSG